MTFTELKRTFRNVMNGLTRHAYASENRFIIIGTVGFVGFPLYYLIWTYLFPQPYENLALRLIGSCLCAFLMIKNHWPAFFRRYLPIIWYTVILYTLPFYFTFMLLKNNNSNVWLMSTLAAIFLMVLILDWLSLTLLFFLGTGLAWICYAASTNILNPGYFYLQYVAIYGFVIVGGSIFNYKAALLQQEKLQGMAAASGNIAHELRTPLLGIKSGAVGLARYIPLLFEGYQLAKDHDLAVPKIRTAHYNALIPTLERIEAETNYANTIIDMLLMNVGRESIDSTVFEQHTAYECIEEALKRYPFNSALERNLITWQTEETFTETNASDSNQISTIHATETDEDELDEVQNANTTLEKTKQHSHADFIFFGSKILIVHILFNLIKNALYHIAEVKKGSIYIWCSSEQSKFNEIHFKDTGAGIKADVLPLLFERFFTTTVSGTGIGLSFSKMVMESLGGEIKCLSEYGEYTEFVLSFPKPPDDLVA